MRKLNRKKFFSNKINASFLRYFLSFSLIILFFLWLLEVVLLKSFYQYTIENSFKNTVINISYNIQNNNLEELIEKYVKDNDFSIRLVSIDDNSLDISISSGPFSNYLNELSKEDVNNYYEISKNNRGQKTIIFENFKSAKIEPDEGLKNKADTLLKNDTNNKDKSNDFMLYTQIITINDFDYLFLGYSFISPVEIVSSTLLTQLKIVTVFFIIASILFSYIISRKFVKPIMLMNESAKQLANGNYDVEFIDEGFDEINELNNTLNYASSELKKVDSLQKEIISNISHDLRTPLTMIGGYAELLKDVPLERTEENLQVIIDETNRLNSLVNDVVDINHISEVNKLELSDFDLTDLITNIINNYSKIYQNEFNFVFKHEDKALVNADQQKITQVIYNLLNNAVNYSIDSNVIEVEQTIMNNTVTIKVINKGENITKEDMKHIFERYYRSNNNHVRAKSGSGLGLSIVKSIIILHHGEVNVSSKNNINSFSFTISCKNAFM